MNAKILIADDESDIVSIKAILGFDIEVFLPHKLEVIVHLSDNSSRIQSKEYIPYRFFVFWNYL